MCITTGGKKRQLAANCQRQKASYCDKFVAAFCRFLPLRFCPVFSTTISLGDGVYPKNHFHDGLFQRRFMVGVNVGNCRRSWLRIPVGISRGIVVDCPWLGAWLWTVRGLSTANAARRLARMLATRLAPREATSEAFRETSRET